MKRMLYTKYKIKIYCERYIFTQNRYKYIIKI